MEKIKSNYFNKINQEFDQTWLRLSQIAEKTKETETKRAVRKLHRCLKWSTAYSFIQSYCGEIIKPYASQYNILIKKFWNEYVRQNLSADVPPTPVDFFNWYCNSETIEEEKLLF